MNICKIVQYATTWIGGGKSGHDMWYLASKRSFWNDQRDDLKQGLQKMR
jgi:hypothetical protein